MKLSKSFEEHLSKLHDDNEKQRQRNDEEIRRHLDSENERADRKKQDLIGYGCSCVFVFFLVVFAFLVVVFR